MHTHFKNVFLSNGEPAVLFHYEALIGNHGIVQIAHCRWHCNSLVKPDYSRTARSFSNQIKSILV